MSGSLSITRENVHSWSPCAAGTDEFIESCFGDRQTLTFNDLCGIPHLSDEYLLWTALRPQVIRPDKLELVRLQFLQLIGEEHSSYSNWCNLSAVDLIGKVVRAHPAQTPDQTYRLMAEIMRGCYAD